MLCVTMDLTSLLTYGVCHANTTQHAPAGAQMLTMPVLHAAASVIPYIILICLQTSATAPAPMSTAPAPDLGPTEAKQAPAPSFALSGTAPATSPSLAPVALPTINLQGVSSLTPQAQQGVINAVAETLGVPASQLSLQQPGAAGPNSAAAISVRSAPAGRRLMQVGSGRWERQLKFGRARLH